MPNDDPDVIEQQPPLDLYDYLSMAVCTIAVVYVSYLIAVINRPPWKENTTNVGLLHAAMSIPMLFGRREPRTFVARSGGVMLFMVLFNILMRILRIF